MFVAQLTIVSSTKCRRLSTGSSVSGTTPVCDRPLLCNGANDVVFGCWYWLEDVAGVAWLVVCYQDLAILRCSSHPCKQGRQEKWCWCQFPSVIMMSWWSFNTVDSAANCRVLLLLWSSFFVLISDVTFTFGINYHISSAQAICFWCYAATNSPVDGIWAVMMSVA